MIAELKMILAMQVRVNNRTRTYAAAYVEKEGEETKDPDIKKELADLADRQKKIFQVTDDIYREKNK
jgi:hypothetical protein